MDTPVVMLAIVGIVIVVTGVVIAFMMDVRQKLDPGSLEVAVVAGGVSVMFLTLALFSGLGA